MIFGFAFTELNNKTKILHESDLNHSWIHLKTIAHFREN